MVDIIETIQEKYVPKGQEGRTMRTIFFGGDQLTEERAKTYKWLDLMEEQWKKD